MAYTPQTWTDSPSTATPISAARLTVIENGIQAAAATADTAAAAGPSGDTPHYLIWSGSAWPDRPADTRPAIFVGGSLASNIPADGDLRSGDVWMPATA